MALEEDVGAAAPPLTRDLGDPGGGAGGAGTIGDAGPLKMRWLRPAALAGRPPGRGRGVAFKVSRLVPSAGRVRRVCMAAFVSGLRAARMPNVDLSGVRADRPGRSGACRMTCSISRESAHPLGRVPASMLLPPRCVSPARRDRADSRGVTEDRYPIGVFTFERWLSADRMDAIVDEDRVDAAESSPERVEEEDVVNTLLPREDSGESRGESFRKMREEGAFSPPRPSVKAEVLANCSIGSCV